MILVKAFPRLSFRLIAMLSSENKRADHCLPLPRIRNYFSICLFASASLISTTNIRISELQESIKRETWDSSWHPESVSSLSHYCRSVAFLRSKKLLTAWYYAVIWNCFEVIDDSRIRSRFVCDEDTNVKCSKMHGDIEIWILGEEFYIHSLRNVSTMSRSTKSTKFRDLLETCSGIDTTLSNSAKADPANRLSSNAMRRCAMHGITLSFRE